LKIIRALDLIYVKIFGIERLIAIEEDYHRNRVAARKAKDWTVIDSLLWDLSNIDSKSSALLTHISVVIAILVLSFIYFVGDLPLTQNHLIIASFIIFEIILYLIVATIALRCLNIMGPPNIDHTISKKKYVKSLIRECLIRRRVYLFCLRFVIISTIILLLSIFVKIGSLFWNNSPNCLISIIQ
jgi:hypothetical protein